MSEYAALGKNLIFFKGDRGLYAKDPLGKVWFSAMGDIERGFYKNVRIVRDKEKYGFVVGDRVVGKEKSEEDWDNELAIAVSKEGSDCRFFSVVYEGVSAVMVSGNGTGYDPVYVDGEVFCKLPIGYNSFLNEKEKGSVKKMKITSSVLVKAAEIAEEDETCDKEDVFDYIKMLYNCVPDFDLKTSMDGKGKGLIKFWNGCFTLTDVDGVFSEKFRGGKIWGTPKEVGTSKRANKVVALSDIQKFCCDNCILFCGKSSTATGVNYEDGTVKRYSVIDGETVSVLLFGGKYFSKESVENPEVVAEVEKSNKALDDKLRMLGLKYRSNTQKLGEVLKEANEMRGWKVRSKE